MLFRAINLDEQINNKEYSIKDMFGIDRCDVCFYYPIDYDWIKKEEIKKTYCIKITGNDNQYISCCEKPVHVKDVEKYETLLVE